jgi:hypothetical protein
MQTTGEHDDRSTSAAGQRCLRSRMRAVVRPHCCTSCCTELTLKLIKCQGSSVILPSATLAPLALASPPLAELFANVRRNPCWSAAIVTQLVTHRPGVVRQIQGTCAGQRFPGIR